MAVQINVQAFRDSLPAAVGEAAARLRHDGSVGKLESAGGGVQAVVHDGQAVFQPWVGIVERAFTGDCDCAPVGEELCAHAVAVALTAFDTDVVFASAATPPGADPAEPERAAYRLAVQRLAPRQLADLLAEHAVRDRLLATRLLNEAGMLDPADQSGLADFRAVLRDASNATNGSRWQISDVETAGHRLAEEVEILCARPPTIAMLDLVEESILVWDELAGYLIDAYYESRTDPEEIGDALVDAHRDLCERLDLEPGEIDDRVTELVRGCDHGTVDVEAYADLLGDHARQ